VSTGQRWGCGEKNSIQPQPRYDGILALVGLDGLLKHPDHVQNKIRDPLVGVSGTLRLFLASSSADFGCVAVRHSAVRPSRKGW